MIMRLSANEIDELNQTMKDLVKAITFAKSKMDEQEKEIESLKSQLDFLQKQNLMLIQSLQNPKQSIIVPKLIDEYMKDRP
jgi:hypothetical protein